MLGSMPIGAEGDQMIVRLINHYAEEAGIIPEYTVSKGTIAIPREKNDGERIIIAVNLDGKGGEVVYNGTHKVDPFGYTVVRL